MHRNDLRFYTLSQLLEIALVLGVKIDASKRIDVEKTKDAIVAGFNALPPFMKAQMARVDKFLGAFR